MNTSLVKGSQIDLDTSADPVAAVLAMCEQGRAALVRAVSVTEAKDVLSAVKILEHAIKVRDLNTEAAVAASLLRVRAERRVGELLAAQIAHEGGRPKTVDADDGFPRLAEIGLTRDESSKYQRLAAVPEEKFDAAITEVASEARAKGRNVTHAAVMRAIDPDAERTPWDFFKAGDAFKRACDILCEREAAAIEAIGWGHFPGPDQTEVLAAGALQACLAARQAIGRVEAALHKRRE